MRILIQRVSSARVKIDELIKSEISFGLLVFLGIGMEDSEDDIAWLCHKIFHLRIFNDINGKMNLALTDNKFEIMVISQFTLMANPNQGNRPSYAAASRPEAALPLYNLFIKKLSELTLSPIKTGEFGADMKVSLTNDGPVTLMIDSKNRK